MEICGICNKSDSGLKKIPDHICEDYYHPICFDKLLFEARKCPKCDAHLRRDQIKDFCITFRNREEINIFDAVIYDYIEDIKEYIKNGGDVNVTQNPREYTLLHMATTELQTKLLIDAGANVRAVAKNVLFTPLHKARSAGQARLLLEAGADVNARDYAGRTPLSHCETEEQRIVLINAGGVL